MSKNMQFHNSNIYMATFNDMDDFLSYVKDAKVNSMFLYNMDSVENDYNFTGTHSYREAWNLCRYTMSKGFSQFADKFDSLNYFIDSEDKQEDYYSVSGFLPSVPRYLLNIPTSMHSYHLVKEEPTVHIYMNFSYSADTSLKAVENRGVIVLSLISYLERKGYKVNFYGFDLSHTRSYSEMIFMEIPFKKDYEKLNLKTLYFPLVHPSFLRRLLFRVTEKLPLRSREWVGTYGIPSKYQESIQFLEHYQKVSHKDHIIYISSPNELEIYGNNLREDYQRAIHILNQNYHIEGFKKRKG